MLTLIHGDDGVSIRAQIARLCFAASQQGYVIEQVDARGLTVAVLESLVGTDQLFSPQKLLCIDRLHSLPKSKMRDALIDWISNWASTHQHDPVELLLTEEKILTPTQLKKFLGATIEVYKLPQILFSFIESIGKVPQARSITQFHEVIETQEVELVFAMLVRQIRLLLLFVSSGIYQGPPFGKSKVESQAKNFDVNKLLLLHNRLLHIDVGQKTSRSPFTLSQEIDLFLSAL